MPASPLLNYGPWAVVTGASSGIGAEFCRQLGAEGLNMVLVARRRDRLEALAQEIEASNTVETKVIQADLSTTNGYQQVLSETAMLDVGLLINNAGVHSMGSFLQPDMEKHARLVAINVTCVMALAHGFGRRLVRRGAGGIIFVSSMGNQPSPFSAPYCCSKAFVSTLSLSLREELRGEGIDVMVLEPGYVKSEMSAAVISEMDFSKLGMSVMDTDECVRTALEGFVGGRARVMPGFGNQLIKWLFGLLPDALKLRIVGRVIRGAVNPNLLKHE